MMMLFCQFIIISVISKLCEFIRANGVVKLKELIERKFPIIFNQKYVNMCHLCYSINSSYSEETEIESLIIAHDNLK